MARKKAVDKWYYIAIKRFFDIFFALLGLIILIPCAILIKILYMCEGDFHSIFYTQDRIGLNGKIFKMYKFRSMCINADDVLVELLKNNRAYAKEYKLNKKLKNDPRITRTGRLIRRLSIDEIPQFINVLIGDMSLIGNRPYLPREKSDMGSFYYHIIKTKPGLTGYWQVSGRSNVTFLHRLELEKYYSLNHSLKFDIKIFFKTFKVVIFGNGAD